MFYIKHSGPLNFRITLSTAKTFRAAKLEATAQLELGMHVFILDKNKNPLAHRRFWSNYLCGYGWDAWTNY